MILRFKKYFQFFCLVFVSVLFLQCTSDTKNEKDITADLKVTELKIESNKKVSDYTPNITGQLSKFKITKNLNNIKDYEINYVAVHDAYFIQGRGIDNEGKSILFRQEIGLKKMEDGSQIINFRPGSDLNKNK